MKKSILFVIPTFEIGGTVVSTKNLILLLDKEKYDVSVLSMTGIGSMRDMYNDIPQVPTTFILSSLAYNSWKDETKFMKRMLVGIIRKIAKHQNVRNLIFKYQAKRIYKINYDTIISCQEGICSEFVSHIECCNKIAWVRCDYSKYIKTKNKFQEEEIYSRYDSIVCVSDLTSKKFKEIYPHYSDRILAINNPQSERYILEQSLNNDHDISFTKKGYTIVSIGRIDPVKRFTEIPQIASFLVAENVEFRWYIIGDGSVEEKKQIKQNIIKENVEDYVICLGLKTNPHYYIKNADLLVSLSSSEACPRVINEAKILHTPVVCTDFDTAYEYIDNMENGIISPLNEIHQSILQMIQDRDLHHKITNNISDFHFDNDEIMNRIYEIL